MNRVSEMQVYLRSALRLLTLLISAFVKSRDPLQVNRYIVEPLKLVLAMMFC